MKGGSQNERYEKLQKRESKKRENREKAREWGRRDR